MDLILLGAPGAGKGTQGALLAERMGVPKIATGDMLRDALRQGTTLGQEAKRYMDAGELVPDSVVLGLVREALTRPEARTGAIFDGYPRNVAQAESLGGLLDEIGRRIEAIVYIDVPEEVIVRRMGGRRTDPETGAVYHLEHAPPPAEIAGRLVQRPDDQEETVRNRLAIYRQTTAPLVAFYESAGVPVHRVDGTQPIEQVQGEIMRLLGQ
jgi:adenylate kinase